MTPVRTFPNADDLWRSADEGVGVQVWRGRKVQVYGISYMPRENGVLIPFISHGPGGERRSYLCAFVMGRPVALLDVTARLWAKGKGT